MAFMAQQQKLMPEIVGCPFKVFDLGVSDSRLKARGCHHGKFGDDQYQTLRSLLAAYVVANPF